MYLSRQQCPWIVHLADQLLTGQNVPNYLLSSEGNPFYNITTSVADAKAQAPRFVRAVLYEVCVVFDCMN
jgi:hypothetical protein